MSEKAGYLHRYPAFLLQIAHNGRKRNVDDFTLAPDLLEVFATKLWHYCGRRNGMLSLSILSPPESSIC